MNVKESKTTNTIFLVVGVIIVISGLVLGKISNFNNVRFIISGLVGIGGAFTAISSINLYKIKIHPQEYEEQMSAKYDERNIFIRSNAGYATFILTLCVVGIASIIFLTLDHLWFAIVALGTFIIQIISYWIFVRYYNKKL